MSLPIFLVSHLGNVQLSGREGCCGEPRRDHPALRTYTLLPPTAEQLHRDPSDEWIYGVTWKDHGSDAFHSCAFDKGHEREANQ
jgi:hypothetical protein